MGQQVHQQLGQHGDDAEAAHRPRPRASTARFHPMVRSRDDDARARPAAVQITGDQRRTSPAKPRSLLAGSCASMTNTASAAVSTTAHAHSPRVTRAVGQPGAQRQREQQGGNQDGLHQQQRARSRAPAPGRRSRRRPPRCLPTTAAVRSNVRNITELTPCSWGTSIVARWRTTMPIAEEHRGEHGQQHHQTMAYQSDRAPFGPRPPHRTRTTYAVAADRPARGRFSRWFRTRPSGHRQQMNLRRLVLLVGAVALIVGVIGLLVPVSVPGPDNGSIGCGNGLVAGSVGRAGGGQQQLPPTCRYSDEDHPAQRLRRPVPIGGVRPAGVDHSGGRRWPGGDRRVVLRRGPRAGSVRTP